MKEWHKDLVFYIRTFLGEKGIAFFRECLAKYGTVSPVYLSTADGSVPDPKQKRKRHGGSIPHPVHFREGMQVRNAMRNSGLCKHWTDHDFDDAWTRVVRKAIKEEDEGVE